jgi:hypothetical protein
LTGAVAAAIGCTGSVLKTDVAAAAAERDGYGTLPPDAAACIAVGPRWKDAAAAAAAAAADVTESVFSRGLRSGKEERKREKIRVEPKREK